jgi:hypothetical protein
MDQQYKYLTKYEAIVYSRLYATIITQYNRFGSETATYINALNTTIGTATNKSQLYNVTLYMATRNSGSPLDYAQYKYGNLIGIENIDYFTDTERIQFFSDMIDRIDRNNLKTDDIAAIINTASTSVTSTIQLYQNLPNFMTQVGPVVTVAIPPRTYTPAETELNTSIALITNRFTAARAVCRNIKLNATNINEYRTILIDTIITASQSVGAMYNKYVNSIANVPAMNMYIVDMRRLIFKLRRRSIRSYTPSILADDVDIENNIASIPQIYTENNAIIQQYNTLKGSVVNRFNTLHVATDKQSAYLEYKNLLTSLITHLKSSISSLQQLKINVTPAKMLIYNALLDNFREELDDANVLAVRANSTAYNLQNVFDREYGTVLYPCELYWSTAYNLTLERKTFNLQAQLNEIKSYANNSIGVLNNLKKTTTDTALLNAYDMIIAYINYTVEYYTNLNVLT